MKSIQAFGSASQQWAGTLLVLLVSFGLTACGGKSGGDSAESAEGVAQADTADIDASGSAETLPAVDQATTSAENPTVTPETPATENVASTPSAEQTQMPPSSPTQPANEVVQSPPSSSPPSASGTGQMASYTVQKGDTLMKIAFNIYGDISQWKNIYELNRDSLKNANRIVAGMNIKYDKPATEANIERNGEPYLIKKGDTLGTIADDVYAQKSKWRKIYENNRSLIKDPNKIFAGFYLYYQITEEEKQNAERIRGKKNGSEQLGAAEKVGDSAAVSPAKKGSKSAETSGLNALMGAPSRQPASKSAR